MVFTGLIVTVLVILIIFCVTGLRVVMEYERGVKFTLGRFSSMMGPGLHLVVPIFQTFERVDIRVRAMDIEKQECITKDNVSVLVDTVAYVAVIDSKKSIIGVEKYSYAVSQLAQTTLRNVIGEVTLDALLANREQISHKIREHIDKAVDKWGLDVERVELRHIELPENMKRIMAREAEAEREKRGIIIKSEGEVVAAESLSRAAKFFDKSPAAMQLRSLQTLSDISADPSMKFVLFPMELMNMFNKK